MTRLVPADVMAENNSSASEVLTDNVNDFIDFGSDEEEAEILNELLAQVASQPKEEQTNQLVVTDIEDYEQPRGVLLPKDYLSTSLRSSQINIEAEIEILRDFSTARADVKRQQSPDREAIPPAETAEPDGRSPLEKFRKPPKKALSVTDLVSPAWCELQYHYVLSKHGRKRRTPAMKQGTAVHKALEDEVHVTVPVTTTKIEDSWGLRIWNICQGLSSLRNTGRTRELEIWGTIGGELVNGVVDELSYECPDPQYKENLKAKGVPVVELPEYQTSITEYLLAKPEKAGSQPKATRDEQDEKRIYITDVKTRATPTLPTGSSLRPTIVQLHLYHHMLENLVQGNFTLNHLTERYKLNPDETFSDSFLAQLGSLNQEMSSQSSSDSAEARDANDASSSSQDSMDILLQHNTLSTLWEHMMLQFKKTFLFDEPPRTLPLDATNSFPPPPSQQSTSDLEPPPSQPTRLSPLLTASYMSSNYKHTSSPKPRVLGRKSFQFNPSFLHSYLSESLSWWRGEREAKGVTLQEAWKCRSCDFRNDCSWILERDQSAFDEAMERRKMREMAGIEGENVMKRSKV